jgi:hypothetical protein
MPAVQIQMEALPVPVSPGTLALEQRAPRSTSVCHTVHVTSTHLVQTLLVATLVLATLAGLETDLNVVTLTCVWEHTSALRMLHVATFLDPTRAHATLDTQETEKHVQVSTSAYWEQILVTQMHRAPTRMAALLVLAMMGTRELVWIVQT